MRHREWLGKEVVYGKGRCCLRAKNLVSWSPGESCEARNTVLTPHCANRCPRSCADLWDRVQCLQGPCLPGSPAILQLSLGIHCPLKSEWEGLE